MKFSILVNGSPIDFFTQGLRQGNSLSPLLFVIVIEVLSKMILASIHHGFKTKFFVGDPMVTL